MAKVVNGQPTIQMTEFSTMDELLHLFPESYVIQILEWAKTAEDNDTIILGADAKVCLMYIEIKE